MPNSNVAVTRETTPSRGWELYDPFAKMMSNDLRSFFTDRSWPTLNLPEKLFERTGRGDWTPKVDVFEKKGKLVVRAELPGIEKKDLQVKLVDGALTLSGERHEEEEVEKEDYYHCESTYGSFFRRIPLDFEPDPGQVKAQFKDGVLNIGIPLPKKAKAEAKNIVVS